MLARPLARAMLASWFVARGVDAVRRPAAHVEESTPVLRAVAERVSGPLGHDLTTYLDGPTVRRAARRDRLVQALTATGGAILAGVDREGRPGIAWRVEHARAARAAARAAKSD